MSELYVLHCIACSNQNGLLVSGFGMLIFMQMSWTFESDFVWDSFCRLSVVIADYEFFKDVGRNWNVIAWTFPSLEDLPAATKTNFILLHYSQLESFNRAGHSCKYCCDIFIDLFLIKTQFVLQHLIIIH